MRTIRKFVIRGLVACPALFAGAFSINAADISGQVIDKHSRTPLSDATVEFVGTSLVAQTDGQGQYAIQGVPEGTYILRFSASEYMCIELPGITVRPTTTLQYDLALEPCKQDSESSIEVVAATKHTFLGMVRTSCPPPPLKPGCFEAPPVEKVYTVDDLLKQVADIETNVTGVVFIRGTRAGEVTYIVDVGCITCPAAGSGNAGANLKLRRGGSARESR